MTDSSSPIASKLWSDTIDRPPTVRKLESRIKLESDLRGLLQASPTSAADTASLTTIYVTSISAVAILPQQ